MPDELAQLCQGAKTAWSALGQVDYGRKSSEIGNAQFRRSLYFVKPLRAGDTITAVLNVRPASSAMRSGTPPHTCCRLTHPDRLSSPLTATTTPGPATNLSLIHISEPTRPY